MSPDKEQEPAPLAADFDAAEDTPPKGDPEASVQIDEPPAKSAAEQRFDDIMALPEDERSAAFSDIEKRMEEKGITPPWKARQEEEVAARTAAASQNADRERRQAEIRSWQTNGDAARANLNWLVNDLGERWEKRAADKARADAEGRSFDDSAPRFDQPEFDKQIDAYSNAQATLLSHSAITEIGNAMHDAIAEHGGTITEEELLSISKAVSRADKVRAYMNALATRVKKEVSTDMEREIEKRIKAAVDAEAGAIRAEVLSDLKVAPETATKAPAGQKRYSEMTPAERANLSKEERQTLTAAALEG